MPELKFVNIEVKGKELELTAIDKKKYRMKPNDFLQIMNNKKVLVSVIPKEEHTYLEIYTISL